MTQTPVPAPRETTVEILNRQLLMLKELGEIGMVVVRSQAHAAVAAGHAVEVLLADDFWQPETGRALALAGSKHAADAYQAVARSQRLTLLLEKATALTADDVRAGVTPQRVGETSAVQIAGAGLNLALDGPHPGDADGVARTDSDTIGAERGEFERAERLPAAGFQVTVNGICEEIGAEADWATWAIHRRPLDYQPFAPKPPDWSETRPPPGYRPGKVPIPSPRHGALAPSAELLDPVTLTK